MGEGKKAIEGVLAREIYRFVHPLCSSQSLNCEAACVFLPDMEGEEKPVLNELCRFIALFILKHFVHFTRFFFTRTFSASCHHSSKPTP